MADSPKLPGRSGRRLRETNLALVVLVAAVLVLAILVVLSSVPVVSKQRNEANRFSFTMTESDQWYYAPNGPPCPPPTASGCTATNFFAPPPNVVGPYLVSFVWYSNNQTSVQFLFLSPTVLFQNQSWIFYSANGTDGSFAINSTATVPTDPSGHTTGPWWMQSTPFLFTGAGTVTVVGAVTYTAETKAPLL